MDIELLRERLLLTLYTVRPLAITADYLHQSARSVGFGAQMDDITRELAALETKGYVSHEKGALYTGSVKWKLAAAGIDLLETQTP